MVLRLIVIGLVAVFAAQVSVAGDPVQRARIANMIAEGDAMRSTILAVHIDQLNGSLDKLRQYEKASVGYARPGERVTINPKTNKMSFSSARAKMEEIQQLRFGVVVQRRQINDILAQPFFAPDVVITKAKVGQIGRPWCQVGGEWRCTQIVGRELAELRFIPAPREAYETEKEPEAPTKIYLQGPATRELAGESLVRLPKYCEIVGERDAGGSKFPVLQPFDIEIVTKEYSNLLPAPRRQLDDPFDARGRVKPGIRFRL
jgi:hypothetical protein